MSKKSYQPDSLHPYIMDERIKKATGSGGISNIPIASADTLGGIKVPADSGISVDADGAISINIDVSTNEVLTGCIIDNKPEYVKEISLANTSLTAGDNIDILVSGASQYEQVTECKLVYTSDTEKGSMDCPVWIDVNGSKVSAKPTGTASSLTSLKAILRYVKATE